MLAVSGGAVWAAAARRQQRDALHIRVEDEKGREVFKVEGNEPVSPCVVFLNVRMTVPASAP
jgi:hypothetical protein